MVLSSKVSVRAGGVHGRCWFAASPIRAGEMVWEKGDAVYHDIDIPKEQLLTWDEAARDRFMALAYQVRPGVYRGTDPALADTISEEEANESHSHAHTHSSYPPRPLPSLPHLLSSHLPPPLLCVRYFVNHSCDGNCWYQGDDLLVAMRDIEEGEELVYDYALTEADPDWVLAPQCLCGKAACRGRVTGNDWQRADLQLQYADHFTSHILALIKASNKDSIEAERSKDTTTTTKSTTSTA